MVHVVVHDQKLDTATDNPRRALPDVQDATPLAMCYVQAHRRVGAARARRALGRAPTRTTEARMRVGDRVAWTGAVDFGRREVRWVGTILATGQGVVSGFVLDGDAWREIGPRHPAAMVLTDVPQHGMAEHLWGSGETTGDIAYAIRLDAMELVEACSDERHRELTDLVTLHQRRALVCACRTCRPSR